MVSGQGSGHGCNRLSTGIHGVLSTVAPVHAWPSYDHMFSTVELDAQYTHAPLAEIPHNSTAARPLAAPCPPCARAAGMGLRIIRRCATEYERLLNTAGESCATSSLERSGTCHARCRRRQRRRVRTSQGEISGIPTPGLPPSRRAHPEGAGTAPGPSPVLSRLSDKLAAKLLGMTRSNPFRPWTVRSSH